MLFSTIKKLVIISAKVAFVILAFYWIFKKIDTPELLEYIKGSNLFYLFLSYLASHAALTISAFRARYYFSTFDLYLKKFFSWALCYVGMFFNVLLPGGVSGDGYKVYLLWKYEKFSKLKAFRVALYERVNGVVVLIFIGLILFLFTDFIRFIPYGDYLTYAAIASITPGYLISAKYILRDKVRTMIGASTYSIGVQVSQIVSAMLIIYALRPEAGVDIYVNYIFLFTVASIVAIIPISIGGAGLRELTFLYGSEFMIGADVELGVAVGMLVFVIYVLTAIIGLPLTYKLKDIKRLER